MKTEKEYYDTKGGCLILSIKLTIITLILALIGVKANAQFPVGSYEHDGIPLYQEPEVYVPAITLMSTFAVNQAQFTKGSDITPQVYFTGAIVSVGLHFGIKALKDSGIIKIKRRKHRRTINFSM